MTRALVTGMVLALACTAAADGGHSRSGLMRLRMVKIMDTQGWGQPVEVARLLIPSDWRSDGGTRWQQNMLRCPQNIIQVYFRAASPDGLTGIEIFPTYAWAWSDDPLTQQTTRQSAMNGLGCDAYPLMSPMDFLARMVAPQVRRGARVAGGEPLPSLAQVQQNKLQAAYGQMIQAQLLRGVRAESGRIRLAYPVNGAPVEEWMTATVSTIAAPSASSAGLMNGQVAMTASLFSVIAHDLFAVHAPAGKLDENARLFATIIGSVRPNPQYQAAVAQFLQGMQRQIQQGVMERQKIWHDAQQYISSSIQQTYAENQRVQDRMAEQFGQALRGVETYVDPATHERVELQGGFGDAWSNGKGEYILSDSPGFDPSVELKESWHRMQKPRD